MDEREMLELAAKAYWGNEIDDVCSIEWDAADNCIAYTHADNQDHNGLDRAFLWNPLTDDGDALRLAVRLELEIRVFNGSAHAGKQDVFWRTEQVGDDPYAATRLAIVRAAAAIGRG